MRKFLCLSSVNRSAVFFPENEETSEILPGNHLYYKILNCAVKKNWLELYCSSLCFKPCSKKQDVAINGTRLTRSKNLDRATGRLTFVEDPERSVEYRRRRSAPEIAGREGRGPAANFGPSCGPERRRSLRAETARVGSATEDTTAVSFQRNPCKRNRVKSSSVKQTDQRRTVSRSRLSTVTFQETQCDKTIPTPFAVRNVLITSSTAGK
jgi:hypothetical protein